MRLREVTIRDLRSVAGQDLTLPVAQRGVTALVGPNQAGKSNLARAIAIALDPSLPFDIERERPRHRPAGVPEVTLRFAGDDASGTGPSVTVAWALGTRSETVTGASAGEDLPVGAGHVVLAEAVDDVGDIVTRLAARLGLDEPASRTAVEAALLTAMNRVIPEVGTVALAWDGTRAEVTVRDDLGFTIRHATGLGRPPRWASPPTSPRPARPWPPWSSRSRRRSSTPGAQEAVRGALDDLAAAGEAAVVITSESPFVISRSPEAVVVAVARDRAGVTHVIGTARGDEPQAPLLGGLFRDPGFAAVIDRTTRIGNATRGVLVFEGGTDEAYLRIAADVLGRADELADLAIQPAGGAMAAALQAIVLRAETDTPLLVVLDNDDPGQRAKQTLVSRFTFTNRQQVTTYAEVVPDYPAGTEAEDVFDWRLVDRFVDEQGDAAIRGKRILRADEWHFDLTSAAKSAFVGWLREHAEPDDVRRWGLLLDLIRERLPA